LNRTDWTLPCGQNGRMDVDKMDDSLTESTSENTTESTQEEAQPQRPNIYTIYENEVGGLTGMISEELDEIDKTYPGWFEDAVREAKISSTRVNLKYIESILKRWKAEGKNSYKKDSEQKKQVYIDPYGNEVIR